MQNGLSVAAGLFCTALVAWHGVSVPEWPSVAQALIGGVWPATR